MHAQYLLFDDGCYRHCVEGIDEILPEFEGEFAFACIIILLH